MPHKDFKYQVLYSVQNNKFWAVGYTAPFIVGTASSEIFLLAQTDFATVLYLYL